MPERASAPVMRRLALPIVGLRMLGYSEVQLTGLYCVETLVTLLHQIDYSRRKLPGSDELEQGLARGALVTE
jgi:hypothetical protein